MKCCEVDSSSFYSYFSLFLSIYVCVCLRVVCSPKLVYCLCIFQIQIVILPGFQIGGLRHQGEMKLFSAPKCKPIAKPAREASFEGFLNILFLIHHFFLLATLYETIFPFRLRCNNMLQLKQQTGLCVLCYSKIGVQLSVAIC